MTVGSTSSNTIFLNYVWYPNQSISLDILSELDFDGDMECWSGISPFLKLYLKCPRISLSLVSVTLGSCIDTALKTEFDFRDVDAIWLRGVLSTSKSYYSIISGWRSKLLCDCNSS